MSVLSELFSSRATKDRGRRRAEEKQRNIDLLANPAGLDRIATEQSQGIVDAIRGMGAQNEETAERDTTTDIADRGLAGGGYLTDRVQFVRGRERGKTEMDVMKEIAAARARIAAEASNTVTRLSPKE